MRVTLASLSILILGGCAVDEPAFEPPVPQLAEGKADFSSGVREVGDLPLGEARDEALRFEFEFQAWHVKIEAKGRARFFSESESFSTSLFLFGPRVEGEAWSLNTRGISEIEETLGAGEYVIVLGSADGISKGQYTIGATCEGCTPPGDEPPTDEPTVDEPTVEDPPVGATCFDVDLESAIGSGVATGSTRDGEDRLTAECAGGPAPEAMVRWVAPEDGWYRFSTFGSSFGTVLYVLDGCEGEVIACNNNARPGTFQSQLDHELVEGQAVIIGVDGYWGHQGDYQLNIEALDAEGPDDGGLALRDALLDEVRGPHRHVGYDRARDFVFRQLHNEGGAVECVYTGERVRTQSVPDPDVMNIEHTWPRSRGAEHSPANSDLHHLFPSISEANSKRGNRPFGEVSQVHWSSGFHADDEQASYLGRDDSRRIVFEPPLRHKGDVARALFYFAVRYETAIDHREEQVLRRWHSLDPPNAEERSRNARVAGVQGNRNPFVDRPELVSEIDDF
ncbi:MAG: endonuclease I family protein [Bradymonadia bacterium]